MLGLPNDPLTDEDSDALELDDWELKEGAVARSGAILATESRLVELWRQRGHPKAAIVTRDVVADHRERRRRRDARGRARAGGAVRRAAGRQARSASIPAYARFMTGIKPGEPYDPDTIERARKRMQDLGVFASVSVVEGDTVGPDGLLPITFVLVGAEAASDRRRRLLFDDRWRGARRLLDAPQPLRPCARACASMLRSAASARRTSQNFSYKLATTFRRPGVFTPDTDLTLKLSGERETVDTYESRTIAAKAGVEHRFSPTLTGASAVNVEWADIDDAFGNNRYLIVSLPSKLDYDGRDNKLDPTEGLRGTLDAEPLRRVQRRHDRARHQGTRSPAIAAFGDDDRLVLAGARRARHDRRRRHGRHSGDAALLPRRRRLDPRLRIPHGRAGDRTARWSAASPSSRRRSSFASA